MRKKKRKKMAKNGEKKHGEFLLNLRKKFLKKDHFSPFCLNLFMKKVVK